MNANEKTDWRLYRLDDPCTQETRYIGRTSCLLEVRLTRHLHEPRRSNPEKWAWIRSLAKQGLKPEIRQIDTLFGTQCEAQAREDAYIWSYFAQGADLCNKQGILGNRECFREFLRSEERYRDLRIALNTTEK